MKKSFIAAALLGACAIPATAMAQAASAPAADSLKAGAKVYAADGSEVGTIESTQGENVVIFTGKNRATLPGSSLGHNEKGLLIGMTKAELDSAVEAAEAKTAAAKDTALVAGAEVKSRDGAVVGKVQKVEGDNVTLDLATGSAITLKKEHLTAGAEGLSLFMTEAEFKAAVNAAQPAPTPSEG